MKLKWKNEGHFRSNITVPATSLCMIQFSKTIPQFVRLYISYKMVKSETKTLEDTLLYMGQILRKCVLCHMRTTKVQISLRFRAVLSAYVIACLNSMIYILAISKVSRF